MSLTKYVGDSKMFEYDKYYRECKQQNKPFIKAKINPQHGHYFVHLDLITCNYNLSKQSQNKISNLIKHEIIFMNSVYGKNIFNGFNIDKETAWFDGISVKHVHQFCESLYDLIQKN